MTDDPAIATLLEDAARLATAANAKLGEALAIAEQARRDAAFSEDRRFFKLNPARNYRARIATAQEVEDLHTSGAWPEGWVATSAASSMPSSSMSRPPRSKRSTSSCRRRTGSQGRTSWNECGAGRRSRLGEGQGSEGDKEGQGMVAFPWAASVSGSSP